MKKREVFTENCTNPGMNELLNPSIWKPPKKLRSMTVLGYAFKGPNLIIPIEKDFHTFTINPDQYFLMKITMFRWPVYLKNLVSHSSLQGNHMKFFHILYHISPFRCHCFQNFLQFFWCRTWNEPVFLYSHLCVSRENSRLTNL